LASFSSCKFFTPAHPDSDLIYFALMLLRIISLFLVFPCFLQAQNTRVLSLEEAINTAQKFSPDALVASAKLRGSYWQYKYYKADYLPWLTAEGTLPDMNRSFSRITKPDGRDSFVYRSLSNSSVNLSLSQRIGPTGSQLFVNSGLQRIDIFNEPRSTSYLSTPLSVGIVQPVFTFNSLHWQKKIEPLYYAESKKQYVQDLEDISLKTIDLYFGVLLAQSNMELARLNQTNSDTIYKIAQGRYNLGKIAENDLLQLELNQLNAGLSLQQASITLGAATARLKSFLGMLPHDSLVLRMPPAPDTIPVNMALVWEQAQANNPLTTGFQRRLFEAERDVAKARGDNGLQGNFFAEFGLNHRTDILNEIYTKPEDQEQVRFGIQVPILDWGKGRGAIEMAKTQRDVLTTTLKKERTDFEQEVILQAAEFNLQRSQLLIAQKANDVGQRRYYITKQRYMLGKISITDLNIARVESDDAQRNYISVMQNAWGAYYRLRRITLYDFLKGEPLEKSVIEKL
jgi:outer membrane protein TolC